MNGGILVLVEQLRGSVVDVTFEMLGMAQPLAKTLGWPLYAALVGKDVAALADKLGAADTVLVVEHPQLEMPSAKTLAGVFKQLVERKQISLVLLGGTNQTLGAGASLSNMTGLPFVNFCKNLRLDGETVVVTSQLFGGKILADVRLLDKRGVVWFAPGSHSADAGRSTKMPTVERVELAVEAPQVVFKKYIEPAATDVDITKQDILVGVGRGIQSQDNVAVAEELAQLLGGAVCASRPVIDQGWLPLSRQVGKSGITVKPRLYLAFGISGAPEHWEGMQASQLIVAVNTDPKAPIFDGAHFGVCGDALDYLPLLLEKVKGRKT